MPISINAAKAKASDLENGSSHNTEQHPTRRAATIDARPEDTSLMENSEQANNARWHKDAQTKGKGIKPSVSPDRYHINNNLVVNLAEPIKKPNDLQIRMNQTQYKNGNKANFFPSTATTTTNGSSG